jgi:hypothetical protein
MLSKMTVGFGLSTAVVSIASALLVILKETSPPLKAWMTALTSHHWVTHSLFVIIGFILLGFAFSQTNWQHKIDGYQLSNYLIGAIIISCMLIYGFTIKNL